MGKVALVAFIDEKGKVMAVHDVENGTPLEDQHYDPEDPRRIHKHARLATDNWCCWQKVAGIWKCVPC